MFTALDEGKAFLGRATQLSVTEKTQNWII